MKWYIGQDVVCIKTHSQGVIKENDVFTIKGLKQFCCKVALDISINKTFAYTQCTCGNRILNISNIYWFGEGIFAPLDSLTDISEILKVLEQSVYQL